MRLVDGLETNILRVSPVNRTTVISLRGDRGARKNMVDIDSLDLNLEPQGQG